MNCFGKTQVRVFHMTVDAVSLRATQISLERGGVQAKIADTGLHLGYAPNFGVEPMVKKKSSKLIQADGRCMSKSLKEWVCSLAWLGFCRPFADFTLKFRQVCPSCGEGKLCHVRLAAMTQRPLVSCGNFADDCAMIVQDSASQRFSMERNLSDLPAA